MSKVKDITGDTYGALFVLSYAGMTPARKARWYCLCVCGNIAIPVGASLRAGHTTSCGCVRDTMNITHGATGTPTHRTWLALKARCSNPHHADYPQYGARGIKVCKRWHKFEHFLADMGTRPEGMTMERRNVNGNYTPKNCLWATHKQQSINKRNTTYLTANGERLPLMTWAARLGMPPESLRARLRYGWSEQRVCTTAVLIKRKRVMP